MAKALSMAMALAKKRGHKPKVVMHTPKKAQRVPDGSTRFHFRSALYTEMTIGLVSSWPKRSVNANEPMQSKKDFFLLFSFFLYALETSSMAREFPTIPVIIITMGKNTDTEPQLAPLPVLSCEDLETFFSHVMVPAVRFCGKTSED